MANAILPWSRGSHLFGMSQFQTLTPTHNNVTKIAREAGVAASHAAADKNNE